MLHREVVAQGFTGGYGIVRGFVEQQRARPDLRAIPKPLSTRQVTGWICRHPDNLTDRLTTILDTCPELRTAAELVRSVAAIMTQRQGHRLSEWLARAKQADLPVSWPSRRCYQVDSKSVGDPVESGSLVERVCLAAFLRRQQLQPAASGILRRATHSTDQRFANTLSTMSSINDHIVEKPMGNSPVQQARHHDEVHDANHPAAMLSDQNDPPLVDNHGLPHLLVALRHDRKYLVLRPHRRQLSQQQHHSDKVVSRRAPHQELDRHNQRSYRAPPGSDAIQELDDQSRKTGQNPEVANIEYTRSRRDPN
jgi:hypothetical protein